MIQQASNYIYFLLQFGLLLVYCPFILRGHPFMTSARRGSGSSGRMWTGGGSAPCGGPHRTLKLEPTDVILSSSNAKKLAFFTRILSLNRIKSGNFWSI